ncbi:MAG: phosphoribosylamine--glycine ligase [Arachnia sp.]
MIVVVLGSGSREHALALALSYDPEVTAIYALPGNPGISEVATCVAVDPADTDDVVAFAVSVAADLVVVGPEAPLVDGLADAVRSAGLACFGPSKEAAQLEGSKAFAKQVMADAGVPTAASRVCSTPQEAAAALSEFGAPYVVKDDGLAGGKGVIVTRDREEAEAHAAACARVVIEEYLDGPEVSLFAICDGERAVPLLPAQDYKRVGDGDAGPNTGGMGAYTPLPWTEAGLSGEIMATVIQPTLDEMNRRGTPFVGLLYAGLALTSRGLRVVEFNVRFGDPETQAVLALLETPLGGVLYAAATGTLESTPLAWRDGSAVVVVEAADGYPGTHRTGGKITLPESEGDAYVLQAGTRLDGDVLVSAGGRVLSVVGVGEDLAAARNRAYCFAERIGYTSGFHRTDIGYPH